MTVAVHIDDGYDVYIGRHSDPIIGKWGSPFTTKDYGLGKFRVANKKEALLKYKEYILDTPELLKSLPELKDKRLGCFCKTKSNPNATCHGDILVELVEQLHNGFEF